MRRSLLLSLCLAAITPAFAADTFELDPVHSGVSFAITHMKASRFHGRFNAVTGKVVFDAADPAKCSIEVQVDANSVDTGNAKRDQHVRSQDFLSTEEFPHITFKSSAVSKKGDKYEVKGTLTFHGVTKEVTAEVEHVGTAPGMKGETRAGFEARLTIKRSEYGMNYLPDALGDEIRLVVWVEGVKQ